MNQEQEIQILKQDHTLQAFTSLIMDTIDLMGRHCEGVHPNLSPGTLTEYLKEAIPL